MRFALTMDVSVVLQTCQLAACVVVINVATTVAFIYFYMTRVNGVFFSKLETTSHPRKVILGAILNRLVKQAEEDQTGSRSQSAT